MQKSTGKIFDSEDAKSLAKELGVDFDDEFVKVESKDMTEKQIKRKQVSKHDNKSKLGKIFLAQRKGIRKRNPKVRSLM